MTIAAYFGILVFILIILYFVFAGKSNSAVSENDAKRFAKLLIAEIKLYETYKVERGLKNNDLYESLSDEIEGARKTYKKRIINSEFERFFDESLVEVLANGDTSKMGQIKSFLT